ncbi:cytochrome P450 [Kineosporia sp. R_H_3]|uniref:cytochrome P450 n=1 Tax=Kineosporia sp. R_H_3 TaxID=1961848 RepID=UPI001179F13D|nr:cytochrome P450 [Kineosporia sp. R_H_3]
MTLDPAAGLPAAADWLDPVLGSRPMLTKDDPEHQAERAPINATLRPKAMTEVWSARFSDNARRQLARLIAVGPDEADLSRDFAAPLAAANLRDLLGFPDDVPDDDLVRWSTAFIDGLTAGVTSGELLDRCRRAQAEVDAVLDDLIPRVRRAPGASITSHLVASGMAESSVRANVKLTISGGLNEPRHVLGTLTWALLSHPDELAALTNGATTWAQAFEEAVRWISPIGVLPRVVTQDVEWFGSSLPAGAEVWLLLAAASRDPQVFEEPDAFQVRRAHRSHVAFGLGAHLCAGRWAAKTSVGEIAVPMLFDALPTLRVRDGESVDFRGWEFRGPESLPVSWS